MNDKGRPRTPSFPGLVSTQPPVASRIRAAAGAGTFVCTDSLKAQLGGGVGVLFECLKIWDTHVGYIIGHGVRL